VELEIKEGNTFVDYTGHNLKFDSLTSCIEYLRGLGLTIKRDTLTRYIKIGKVFHNFVCKYSDIALPDNFEQVGLIMEEHLLRSPAHSLSRKNCLSSGSVSARRAKIKNE
jgi:hypothetical protein